MALSTATVDAAVIGVFGEPFIYTPDGGSAVEIPAFFQDPELEVDGGEVEALIHAPQLTVNLSDVSLPLSGLDTFQRVATGVSYQVKHHISDEAGLVLVYLQKI